MASEGGARDKRLVARHIYQVIRYLIHHCSNATTVNKLNLSFTIKFKIKIATK